MTTAPTQAAPIPQEVSAYLRDLAARGARYHLGLCATDLTMLIAGAGLIEIAFPRQAALVAEVEGANG